MIESEQGMQDIPLHNEMFQNADSIFAGYENFTRIYESESIDICRALRTRDQQKTILKVLKCEYLETEKHFEFQREKLSYAKLEKNGISRIIDYQEIEGQPYIVLQDHEGVSLDRLIRGHVFTTIEFLRIAIRLTEVVIETQNAGVFHCEINPGNIIYNSSTNYLSLIDFGAACFSRHEMPFRDLSKMDLYTLAYIAPEQTGRMNRSLDHRAEFYSLGATFYTLLTQQTPFPAKNRLQLIHAHIAQSVINPTELNPHVPKTISHIVMRLLTKSPDDRYQSLTGLKKDLQRCLAAYETTGDIPHFQLDAFETVGKIRIPQKLYAREKEISDLKNHFKFVSHGEKK